MTSRQRTFRAGLILALALWPVGCNRDSGRPGTAAPPAEMVTKPTSQQADAALQAAAERDRQKYAAMTFEEFKASDITYHEPFEGGKYIVNGDTPVLGDKQLREFFETKVKQVPRPVSNRRQAELIVANVGGVDLIWNRQMQGQLEYCVSRSGFGANYDAVVREIEAATGAWEQVAAVDFRHDAGLDDTCGPSNQGVVFDVRPVNVNGEYLARAFFPNEPRTARNVLIDGSSFQLEPGGKLQLGGILRHELGHALGFRHEHTRPTGGPCFEDKDFRELTLYDPFSVMHYPQCGGKGDWSLTLTARDDNGAACLYGAAPGFTIDPAMVSAASCRTPVAPPGTGETRREVFKTQAVAAGAEKKYGPFTVAAGSLFEASIGGEGASGDPDLYVRFVHGPTTSLYNCRPYLETAVEACAVEAPAKDGPAYVTVRGYSAGAYTLEVKYVTPR